MSYYTTPKSIAGLLFMYMLISIFLFASAAHGERETYSGKPLSSDQYSKKAVNPTDKRRLADYSSAKVKIKEGRYKEALSLLYPFISDPVTYPSAVSDYIVVLVWDNKPDEAIRMYENLPASFPRRAYLLRNVAKAYYDKKNFQKALSLYRYALKSEPSDAEARKGIYSAKAGLMLQRGKYLDTLAYFRYLEEKEGIDSETVHDVRSTALTNLSDEDREALLAALLSAVSGKDKNAIADYILLLAINRDFSTAVKVFEESGSDISMFSDYLASWIAWAYFKSGNIEKAGIYYNEVLEHNPGYIQANTGIAYCLASEKKTDKAVDILDKLLVKHPRNTEIMFARAYAFEKSRDFWSAVNEYERILEITPDNRTAKKLRIRALSDLGISSYALEEAARELPDDIELHDSIQGDMAVDSVNWKEFGRAVSMLTPFVDDNRKRSEYDYITALVGNDDMEEAVETYEGIIDEGISPPPWVKENVAGAYLYLEKPHRALDLYEEVLASNPGSYKSRLGRFYALQDLRRWDEAQEALDSIDHDIPEVLRYGKRSEPNWPKMDVVLARGWLDAYEDRLREADDHFQSYYEKAPANTGIRTGLAHVHYWRGWPRRALVEFRTAETIDPKEVKIKTGKIMTLNTLAFKEQAREEAAELLKFHPKDKHVRSLVRQLKLEEMRELYAEFMISADDDGFGEIKAYVRLTQPVSLYSGVYAFLVWKKAEEDENAQKNVFRRAGAGARHIFNRYLSARQEFSVNYNDGNDFGSFTELVFTPDDYWRIDLAYDSFTTDIPLRASVFDIEADKLASTITYRESEWRSYSLSLSRMDFSDGNERNEGLLGYEQGLYVKNNWMMRLFLDMYASENSRDDAPYFNPDNDLGLSATHMTEHTVKRMYGDAFVHRLYLSAGMYKQSGFSAGATASVRYEHDVDFSETNNLLYGASLGRNVYDGEAVTGYSIYVTWRLLF